MAPTPDDDIEAVRADDLALDLFSRVEGVDPFFDALYTALLPYRKQTVQDALARLADQVFAQRSHEIHIEDEDYRIAPRPIEEL